MPKVVPNPNDRLWDSLVQSGRQTAGLAQQQTQVYQDWTRPDPSITYYQYPISGMGPTVMDMCLGPDGNLWVASYNAGVWKVTPEGVGTEMLFESRVMGICAGPDGNIWATNNYGNLFKISTVGSLLGTYSVGTDPFKICVGPDGNLWVSKYCAVAMVTTGGSVTSYGVGSGSAWTLKGICAGPGDSIDVWVADSSGSIWSIEPGGIAGQHSLGTSPQDICAGPDGNLWVTDSSCVWKYVIATGGGTSYPYGGTGICAGPDGNLWIASGGNVYQVNPDGSGTTIDLAAIAVGTNAVAICPGPTPGKSVWVLDSHSSNPGVWELIL